MRCTGDPREGHPGSTVSRQRLRNKEIVMSADNRNRGTLIGLTAAPLMAATLLCTATFATTGAIAAAPASEVELSFVRADLSQPEAAQSLYKRIQCAARN